MRDKRNGRISDEAARLFEESVRKGPVWNKDSGKGRSKKAGISGQDDPHTLTLDLHGYNLEESLDAAGKAIRGAAKKGYTAVRLITGSGKHSPGLYSPLYAGMEDYLNGTGLDFKKSDGVFTVCLK